MTPSTLSRAIRDLGMTQAQTAGWLRVTEAAVSRWLSGDRPVPGWVEHLMALALESQAAGSLPHARLMDREEASR